LQSDPTAEPNVRGNAAPRSVGRFDGAGDGPLIPPVQCTRDEGTQDPVRAAELPGHRRQQPLAQ
jgi:hypothetical protein